MPRATSKPAPRPCVCPETGSYTRPISTSGEPDGTRAGRPIDWRVDGAGSLRLEPSEDSPVNCNMVLQRAGIACLGLSFVLLAAGDRPARGDVKLPAIFGSHMVLQRDMKDRVWGR